MGNPDILKLEEERWSQKVKVEKETSIFRFVYVAFEKSVYGDTADALYKYA